ncbi:RNA polymerase II mediator complex middle subunit MED1 [Aspergillus lucknowensis]|uniref:Mediator of RNA polymerase II transcription subunit 1 n=1 Tax=Aspergillus lucknowensis TaxID=176173 RepID=A0ABR4LGT4_9EURO
MQSVRIQALGMQGLKLGNSRDNDEERKKHIEEVVELLRTRVAGRGVSREGIERLGGLERFESIWQDDNLNIAGNLVDLEIQFHRGQNVVKDVTLQYATPEATEGGHREEATAVLKRDLAQTPEEGERGSWKKMDNFHKNLHWLARHDKLSQEVNCFEAIEGLYKSVKRLWDEESQNKFTGEFEHLCSGWIGRPTLHKGGRIGLWLDYWTPRARILDLKQRKSPDAMVIDQLPEQSADDESNQDNGNWRIAIECEEGYPSLRVSKDWIGSEVFIVVSNNTEAPSSNDDNDGSAEQGVTVVNWTEPPATLTGSQGPSEGMDLDSNMLDSASPNRRFVARMEPPLDIPLLAASDIYRHLGLQMPQDFKMLSYDGLLAPGWSPLSATGALGLDNEDPTQTGRKKSRVSVQSFDENGKPVIRRHSYTFQPFESAGGRTLKDIPFSHPRQLADILPTLRQYAFLANLIRNTFPLPSKSEDSKSSEQARQQSVEGKTKNEGAITILSNENPNEKKLNLLLGLKQEGETDIAKAKGEQLDGESSPSDELKVDVTLRTQIGQAPMIMLLFTVKHPGSSTETRFEDFPLSKISISFEVGLNGRVSVVDVAGLLDDQGNPTDDANVDDAQATHDPIHELQSKLARVLETSQDIGILVEWVLRWLRQRESRG